MDRPEIDVDKLNRIKRIIAESHRIVIVSHMNADGDALGSMLGMYHLLGGKADMVLTNGCPENFRWMPGSADIRSGDIEREACERLLMDADLIIGVDFNVASRIDYLASSLEQSQAAKILIDHHHSPDETLFDVVVSKPGLSSASELVYWVARDMWGNAAIGREAAQCLYTGMCTDTGSFSFSNEQPSLYEAAAALVKKDIGAAEIHNNIVNTFSSARIRFYGYVLTERLKIYEEKHFAYFYISLADQKRFGVTSADMEGLVNYTLMMKNIEVGVLMREEEGRVKLSFRSKKDVDVNVIACQYFEGGGHTKAAGATSYLSLQETMEKIETIFGLK